MKKHRIVDTSYLVPATEDWVVALGGRVYREKEVRKMLGEAHLCSWGKCNDKQLNSYWQWQRHFDAVHRGKDLWQCFRCKRWVCPGLSVALKYKWEGVARTRPKPLDIAISTYFLQVNDPSSSHK